MIETPSPHLCPACKGYRLLCGREKCIILTRFKVHREVLSKVDKTAFSGATPPEVLIGSRGWPRVTVGPLVAPIDAQSVEEAGEPEKLYGKPLEEILALRSQLIGCYSQMDVKIARRTLKLLEEMRLAALSTTGLEVEVHLKSVPKPKLEFDGFLAPTGPRARLADLAVVELKVPKRADAIVDDVDLKAGEAIRELYRRGFSTYYAARLLSLGMLGRKPERVLVPSRWSITATDTIISKHLSGEIKKRPELSNVELFFTEYIGNKYAAILVPWTLSYEMVEIVMPDCVYMPTGREAWIGSDSEGSRGRWSYPSVGGGYFAAKLPVFEYLSHVKRQAFALVIREVTPAYWAPVGSWKIREALRQALRTKPERFVEVREAVEAVVDRFLTSPKLWLPKARRLAFIVGQRKLTEFMA